MIFIDRTDAGKQLGDQLAIQDPNNQIVLALPRGGIPLAIEIAKKYFIPFDIALAKKMVHPQYKEYAIGAIAENGEPVINEEAHVDQDWIKREATRVEEEIIYRRERYAELIPQQSLNGKDVILVDDGIATGMTMLAAIKAIKTQHPRSITVAVPIIPRDTFEELKCKVDQVVYVEIPRYFKGAVGAYYQNFPQISDEEVTDMIKAFYKQK